MGGDVQQKAVEESLLDKLKLTEASLRNLLTQITPMAVSEAPIPVNVTLNYQESFLYNAPELIRQADSVSPLVHGPLNKTKSTRKFEALVKHILANRKVTPRYQDGQVYLDIQIGKSIKSYHLNEIMKNAYLQHVEFGILPQKQYCKYLKKHHPSAANAKDIKKLIEPYQQYIKTIPEAYQLALTRYTGEEYDNINNFLRGKYELFQGRNQKLLDCILDVAMTMGGLNITHDQVDLPHFVVRGESDFVEEKKQRRVHLAENNGIEYTRKLISTSVVTSTLSDRDGVYINPRGKYIAGLSQHPEESELLMPPSQLRWLSHRNKDYFVAQVVETPVGIPEQECFVPPSKANATPGFVKAESAAKRRKKSVIDAVSPLNPLGDLRGVIDYLNANYYVKPYSALYHSASKMVHQTLEREKYGLVHVLRCAYLVPFVAKALYPSQAFTVNDIRRMQLAILFSEAARGTDSPIKQYEKLFYIESALMLERYLQQNPMEGLDTQQAIEEMKKLIISLAKPDNNIPPGNIYEHITRSSKRLGGIEVDDRKTLSVLEQFALDLRLATGDTTKLTQTDRELFAKCSGVDVQAFEGHGTYCLGRLQQVNVPESLLWQLRSEHPVVDTVEWLGKKFGIC